MKREIKFRGKMVGKNGINDWVFGYIQPIFPGMCIMQVCKYKTSSGIELFTIDENTVGQYTGLKDKNGVEIYEGDVVSCNTFRGVVKYDSYTASFQAVSAGWWPISLEYDKHDPFEVIGNIFDNPELDKQFGEVYRKEQ